MENKGKGRIISFRRKKGPEHFTAENLKSRSDVNGSYTGIPVTQENYPDRDDLTPTQDADDL